MTRSVAILDLGMGNLRSVARALERVGAAPSVVREPEALGTVERLVVPGQGHFGDCARALDGALGDAVRAFVATGRPYLGICLGMQALFASSEEAPGMAGLGLFQGTVRRFETHLHDPRTGERLKVPHMGWSEIDPAQPTFARSWFYFVHSYVCVPDDPSLVAARCEHGGAFCAAVARDNVVAVQFHPEKSGADGHALLAAYLEGRWS